ncbi:MAG: hypothetical protein FD164_1062 [Nitrospirae bacterium]|nr:MAG: hypothetical protein FD164_1062 [Nitrospirota bacterium]
MKKPLHVSEDSDMPAPVSYSQLAILMELNSRETHRKLHMYPKEMHYFAMLAASIVGAELSKRIAETPDGVAGKSDEFVSSLLNLAQPDTDGVFQGILETYLLETLKDELRFCCMNCKRFNACLDTEALAVGELFRRRASGEDTEDLRLEITRQVDAALDKTPYLHVEIAHELCKDFSHQYGESDIGSVFGRYAEIAAVLHEKYGLDYRKIQQQMLSVNMEFCRKQRPA